MKQRKHDMSRKQRINVMIEKDQYDFLKSNDINLSSMVRRCIVNRMKNHK